MFFPKIDYSVFRKTQKGWHIPERTLDCHELVYIQNGKGKVSINSKEYLVEKGDVLYFAPASKTALWLTDEPYMCFYGVHFYLENKDFYLSDVTRAKNPIKLSHLFSSLNDEYLSGRPFCDWRESIILQEIIYELLVQEYYKTAPSSVKLVHNLTELMKKNLEEKYTIKDLCEQSKIKKTLLTQAFKDVTGKTPIEYENFTKLQYAKTLVLTTDMKISEISEKIGISDSLYFSKLFKKQFNMSPLKMRKTYLLP